MSIVRAIQYNHFNAMRSRGWDKTYWFFDIHSTILKPNYKEGDIPKEFYPKSKEVLQHISKRDDVTMILYTCSHPHEVQEYIDFFDSHNIHFEYVNENPEVVNSQTSYGCYDKKPYMNVLFEDKAGFDPDKDWRRVESVIQYNDVMNTKNIIKIGFNLIKVIRYLFTKK